MADQNLTDNKWRLLHVSRMRPQKQQPHKLITNNRKAVSHIAGQNKVESILGATGLAVVSFGSK
jgi:hypothetical protein